VRRRSGSATGVGSVLAFRISYPGRRPRGVAAIKSPARNMLVFGLCEEERLDAYMVVADRDTLQRVEGL
jgi:hypothetical protein